LEHGNRGRSRGPERTDTMSDEREKEVWALIIVFVTAMFVGEIFWL
jgi:hypothetical protein